MTLLWIKMSRLQGRGAGFVGVMLKRSGLDDLEHFAAPKGYGTRGLALGRGTRPMEWYEVRNNQETLLWDDNSNLIYSYPSNFL